MTWEEFCRKPHDGEAEELLALAIGALAELMPRRGRCGVWAMLQGWARDRKRLSERKELAHVGH